jgi:chitin synthase
MIDTGMRLGRMWNTTTTTTTWRRPYNYLEPDTPVETRHFGPAPTGRVHRRHKSKKRVQLTNGNLVVDINAPPKMVLPYRGEPEMTTTRYTAVTCDPDEFEKNGFFLRQNESGRRTELFIVITMYNVSSTLDSPCVPPF